MTTSKGSPGAAARLVSLATWYGAVATLLLLAWATVGDAWWLQPFNLATFWWTLPAVPLVLLAGIRHRWLLVVALLVPAAAWVWSYGPLFLPSSAEGGPAGLRIVTFNTWVQRPGIDHVVDLVADLDPDVLVLQEVFPADEQTLRNALAQDLPHVHAVQSPGVGGVVVASRHPLVEVRPVADASASSRSTEVLILDVDGQRLQVVPVHLLSPCPSCGPSLTSRLQFEGEVRSAEMAAVLRALVPGMPTIVAGDFNSNDRSGPYRQLTHAGFRDPHRAVGLGPGFTWPDDGSLPALLRIDWILHRGLVPLAAWVDDGRGSDHRPVVVDFAFTPPGAAVARSPGAAARAEE